MNAHPPPATYRYASPRMPGEGLRIGVTRHLPRGVRKQDWRPRGYFDVWLPMLGPSAELLRSYREGRMTWATFTRRYHAEMKRPECRQVIHLLAAMSWTAPFRIGCYCEDESHCHRSLLLPIILTARKDLAPSDKRRPAFASPPCYLAELDPELDR